MHILMFTDPSQSYILLFH